MNTLFFIIVTIVTITFVYACNNPNNNVVKLHRLVYEEQESIVLLAKFNNKEQMFLIDTGYAGPPVLSISYLATKDNFSANTSHRYHNIMRQMKTDISQNEINKYLNDFVKTSNCKSYTSGCTMKLLSIGDVQEQQSHMLLCDSIRMKTLNGKYKEFRKSDVLVTHPLHGSVHILTCDYLVQMAPCMILAKGELHLTMNAIKTLYERFSFTTHPFRLNGGAFVVQFNISNKIFNLTVDTGSPGPICLNKNAGDSLTQKNTAGQHVLQEGVNGESVCSNLITCDVVFANNSWKDCQIMHNDKNTQGVDGYVGMAFLRAYDILIETNSIGFRLSGLPIKSIDGMTGECRQ